ncbi:MAG TPA: GntR family transcriptional regulator [Stellaceae bacterium]|nr:GntR family transcriptional regulator [Stellaceae bacterium]
MSDAKFAWRLDVPASNSALAYSRLREAILSGQFQPGQRITETGVAALLGVSRTPVREAFTRLTMDGLLRSGEGFGVEVVDPRGELADIHLLREMAEGCAARLAASRATPEEIAEITALAAATSKAAPADLAERVRLNERFHLAIAVAAHAPRVERMVNDYRSLFATEERLEHATSSETKQLLADHHSIAAAIERRDPDAAETAMRDHLRRFFAATDT